MKTSAPMLAVLAMFTASGCSIGSLLNQAQDEADKTLDIICACSDVFGGEAQCKATFAPYLSLFDRECFEDALKKDKKGSREALKCNLKQQRAYNDCLEDNLVCDDYTSYEGCEVHFEAECPEFSAEVEAAAVPCLKDLEIE